MWSLTIWMTCPWFEVFGLNIADLPQCPKTWVGLHLSWKVELNTFNSFLCMTFLNSSVCNFSLELPLGLNRVWANLIRYLSWRMWITFFLSLMGHWIHNYSESLKMLTFLLAFSRWRICQILMKVWRFQKIKLYLCIHLQLYLFIK